MSVTDLHAYYADIMPDAAAFIETCQQQLPTTIWTNAFKCTPQQLAQSLRADGYKVTPLAWTNYGFTIESQQAIGRSWQYLIGLCQIQEQVSMLPVSVLNPQPGEKVIDLCAAPGNKTAQIAIAMQNSGTLIANDKNYGRLRAFGQISKRLGLLNVNLTVHDASNYPAVNNYFDKVLVDAPCSCEGTLRKNLNKIVKPSDKRSMATANKQLAILNKAFKLCKPGGRIVYSTCTFSPYENEAVVDQFLREKAGRVRLLNIEVPGFVASEGLTQWRDQQYLPELQKTWRIWPQQNNSGGFYIALLEKIDESKEVEISTKQFVNHDDADVDRLLAEQCQRFAIDRSVFNDYRFYTGSKRGIYITNQDNHPPEKLNYDVNGLFFIKTNINHLKFSSAATMLFGKYAQQNIVELHADQIEEFIRKQDCVLEQAQIHNCTSMGYVIVKFNDFVLGLGLYLPAIDNQGPRLRSLFPGYFQ